MADFTDRTINTPDGLRLHYRDYAGPHERPPILCIPGLTRNARDFEPVADRFAGEWRVIAVDLRGRGMSEYDPNPANYIPPIYAGDILKLLDQLGIADAVFVGTSLGGIITMLMAMHDAERMAGVLINDIGPVLEQRGLDRIGSYVGQAASFASWGDVADDLHARNADVFPNFSRDQWLAYAHRVAVERKGQIVFDYDLRIAEPFRATADAPPMDIWSYYEALAGRPVTILRGELTDLFALDVAERMVSAIPDVELVTIPGVGHAPMLDEPESLAAIERLLERVLAREDAA